MTGSRGALGQREERGAAAPARGRRLALLVATLSLAASLAVAEAVARRTYGEGFESRVDPYLDHAYRPHVSFPHRWGDRVVTVHTNSLGWKDERPGREVARSVAPRRRVVLLGDSFTEGLGHPQEETFGGVVQRRLGRGFEVLNGGQSSYSTLIEYQRLKRFLAEGYRADEVVVLVDVSDVEDELHYAARYRFAADGEPVRLEGLRYQPLLRWLYDRSALARSLRRLPADLARAADPPAAGAPAPLPPQVVRALAGPRPLTAEGLAEIPYEAYQVLRANWMGHEPSLRGWAHDGLRAVLANLERMQRTADAAGMRLTVVIYPWPTMLYTREDPAHYRTLAATFPLWYRRREAVYGTRPSPAVTAYQRRLRDLCRERGIPLVDLIPELQRVERWHELYIPGDVHWNAAGHRFVGERIARALAADGAR